MPSLTPDIIKHRGDIVPSTPDRFEKIGEVQAMFGNEIAVSPAAIHEVRMQFSAQLGLGFFEDAWQPGNSLKLGFTQGQLVCGQHAGTGFASLLVEEIGSAQRGHQQGGGEWEFRAVVFDEIEKFARLATDARQESEISRRVIGGEIGIAARVFREAAGVEGGEGFVPGRSHDNLSVGGIGDAFSGLRSIGFGLEHVDDVGGGKGSK